MLHYIWKDETEIARKRVYFLLGGTGESGTGEVSKNGGAFATSQNSIVHIGNNHYYLELDSSEHNTLGTVVVRFNDSGGTEWGEYAQILNFNPYDIITTLETGKLFVTEKQNRAELSKFQSAMMETMRRLTAIERQIERTERLRR